MKSEKFVLLSIRSLGSKKKKKERKKEKKRERN